MNTFPPGQCNSIPGGGYGNFVEAGGLRYGHLDLLAPSVTVGATLLQGDQVGTQGSTGHVDPCPGGVHLHWQFLSGTVPSAIDGVATAPLFVNQVLPSTNSIIGEFSTAGATLRSYYINHGSWNNIGWTYKHCPGACTLNMAPNLAWGRMQDFQHDPDAFGAQFATIHVANWDTSHAYRVDSPFWTPWAIGGLDKGGIRRPLSMARQEAGACPSGSAPSCVTYQRFHLGFIWLNSSGIADSVFCPDVFPLPAGDGAVSASDAQWVYSFFVNHAYDVRADIDGNGAITASDAQVVFGNQRQCRP